MKKSISTSIVLVFWVALSFSQSFNTQRLDSLLLMLGENNKFMGSIAVSQNQLPLYTKSVGFTDVEKEVKATESSKFRIGSVSKMFTASLILKAVEDQKLELSQTLEPYFPRLKNADKITVENLLNHSSGIYDFTTEGDYLEWHTTYQTKQDMMERILKGEASFNPNEKSQYSNSNYVLLTFLLEEVYAKPYGQLLDEKIITPLELEKTYFGNATNGKDNESASYRYLGKWKKQPKTALSIPQGAGAIISTPTDLNIFMEHLFSGEIVSQESLAQMKSIKKGFGYGMFHFPYFDQPNYGHTGGIDGFLAVAVYFPEDNLSISITSNALNYPLKDILIPIYNTFNNQFFELPKFESFVLKPEDLDKYLGIYSSKEIPPKISISREGGVLLAQATGQSAFPLEATSENIFEFRKAGVKIEFQPIKGELVLKQGGKEFLFKKGQ